MLSSASPPTSNNSFGNKSINKIKDAITQSSKCHDRIINKSYQSIEQPIENSHAARHHPTHKKIFNDWLSQLHTILVANKLPIDCENRPCCHGYF
jgi:hypothetical protein